MTIKQLGEYMKTVPDKELKRGFNKQRKLMNTSTKDNILLLAMIAEIAERGWYNRITLDFGY